MIKIVNELAYFIMGIFGYLIISYIFKARCKYCLGNANDYLFYWVNYISHARNG